MALSPARNGHANGRANGHRVITHQSASHLPQPAAVRSYARIPQVLRVPNLIQSQIDSYDWFKTVGLSEVFREVSPITDYNDKNFELEFGEHNFREPKFSPEECKERESTYACPLFVTTKLLMKETGEIKEQEIFMGDIPMMTHNGTFIINGAERVVVSQLVRSPGIYFSLERPASAPAGRGYCMAKLIPVRGAWLEFETSTRSLLSVKVDRKKKLSLGVFLRALGLYSDDVMYSVFGDIDLLNNEHPYQYIGSTLERDQYSQRENFKEDDLRSLWDWLQTNVYEPVRRQAERAAAQDREAPNLGMETRLMEALGGHEAYDREAALRVALAQIEFYQRIRPGEPSSLENAKKLLHTHFFDPRRYDLGEVGRHKMDRRLNHTPNPGNRTLTLADIVAIVRTMIRVNRFSDPRVQQKPGDAEEDDIDHLGNRRVRSVGELVQNQVRVGLLRMERMVKEKMTLVDPETAAPQGLVNIRPVVAAVREFFGGSQLSQFMDQTNPLAELTHKRRLSALGPGGLSRERAGFDVRDVHFSHYGRICPIETPEGPNIGLLSSLASYARVNEFGFIESPYRRVLRELSKDSPDLRGRIVTEDIPKPGGGVIVSKGRAIGANRINSIRELPEGTTIPVKPFIGSGEENIIYLSADREEDLRIAQANAQLDNLNQFVGDRVEIRIGDQYTELPPEQAELIDVSPMQIMSVSAALIPFLEHDDANRALMGSNMQRQAVPLLRPQSPIVGTGIEEKVARDSGQMVLSAAAGIVSSANGRDIVVTDAAGLEHHHPLTKFSRTNQGTCFDQRPIVARGDVVQAGDVLADSSSTDRGELALGQNVLVAFMSWEGFNYEDAIILSERLYREDYFTSIHIEKHEVESRDTKLGPEDITRDIPNVGETSLRDLDERGIIRVGAEVGPGDILVGKVTPKGETELTAEEKLLRAIFGEKSRDVKDTSLRVPHGERGKVIQVKELSRENKDELSGAGVNEAVRVWIAQTRKIAVGDKMAGRHGNKGVVARILPEEDMPFLPDGTPVDIILNPIGVPSRMNLGQVLETHLGWAARGLDFRAKTPVFDGANDAAIEDSLARIWFAEQAGAVRRTYDGNNAAAGEIDQARVRRWLNEKAAKYGIDPELIEGIYDDAPGAAKKVCLSLWLPMVAKEDAAHLSAEFAGLDETERYQRMEELAVQVHRERRIAPPTFGKFELFDGRTGEPFDQMVTVGSIYILKLIHLVEDKIHARSTGPYSMITQQPLGGKAQFGGQRFGEMEVWALEAYSAAYNLQEVLTVKSDDVAGRVKTYEAVVKGEPIGQPGLPESFNVLMKELQSLGLAVQLLNEDARPPIGQGVTGDTDLFQPTEVF